MGLIFAKDKKHFKHYSPITLISSAISLRTVGLRVPLTKPSLAVTASMRRAWIMEALPVKFVLKINVKSTMMLPEEKPSILISTREVSPSCSTRRSLICENIYRTGN